MEADRLLEGDFLGEKTAISDKLDDRHPVCDLFQALSNIEVGGDISAIDLSQDISGLKSDLAGRAVG